MGKTYGEVRLVSVEQVPKAPAHTILSVYSEIDPECHEERSGERARKGL